MGKPRPSLRIDGIPGWPVVPHRSAATGQPVHIPHAKPEHACKKLLGNFKRPEGSGLSLWTHPNSWNHFLSDHIVTFAVFPLSVDRTLVRTKWLVAADAVEGVDYDLDNLTRVWTQTNAQDQSLAEGAYRGICSGGYMPGPLADEEYLVKQFLSWYSDQLTETPVH